MTKRVQFIRHATAQADAFRGLEGEISIDLTRKEVRVHDGVTNGGIPLARKDFANVAAATNAIDGKMTAALVQTLENNIESINTIDADDWVATQRIANNAVTNAKLATVASQIIKGRSTAGVGAIEDLTAANVRTIIGLPTIIAYGSFNARNPPTLHEAVGISAITRVSAGIYYLTFTNAQADTNYKILLSADINPANDNARIVYCDRASVSVNEFYVHVADAAAVLADMAGPPGRIHFFVFRT